jgi:molybdenum cofactor cytidylyltransferase
MGRPKQLLGVEGRTMLDAVLEPLRAADIHALTLVTHEAVAARLCLRSDSQTHIAINDDAQSEMIDSIRIGMCATRERHNVQAGDGYLVCPGDHPGITTSDFNRCIAAFRAAPDRIIVATRANRRGHPIIFPASLAPIVESSACDQGLNALGRQLPEHIACVECDSDGICRDVDTPTDYRSLG